MTGRVTLVGGGPGDPGLLTVAGLAALRDADVVLYDHLAPAAALDECRPGTVLIEVGKIPGSRTTSQQRINDLLIGHARAGRNVVRLKGGDPFVFGRGGEEAIACAEAGLAVSVIPGVSSAIAGPELAGIPVTHRGVVQAFTVVAGHVPPGHAASSTDWAALAHAGHTLVILMGVTHLDAICSELITHGLDAHTPAAIIAEAATPAMRVLRGTVTTLPGQVADAGIAPPAVTVIGDVAALDLPLVDRSSISRTRPSVEPVETPTIANPVEPHPEDDSRWSSLSRPVPPPSEGSRRARPTGPTETEVLRPATPADAAELLVLQRACWSREAIDNNSFLIPALHEELDDVIAWLDDWETWVLRRGPRLVGAVRGQRRGTDWEVGRLMVAPDQSGRGTGRRLLEHIEAQAPDPVTRYVLYTGALSARNIRLYERAGYAVLTGDDELLPAIPITVRLTKPRL